MFENYYYVLFFFYILWWFIFVGWYNFLVIEKLKLYWVDYIVFSYVLKWYNVIIKVMLCLLCSEELGEYGLIVDFDIVF